MNLVINMKTTIDSADALLEEAVWSPRSKRAAA
jgi:hypothetical protein